MLESISRQVLLPCAEVQMWLDHLSTVQQNRKRGTAKAAERRRKRKGEQAELAGQIPLSSNTSPNESYKCEVCGEEYEDETLEEELWIECSSCKLWFHVDCVGINPRKFLNISFVTLACLVKFFCLHVLSFVAVGLF